MDYIPLALRLVVPVLLKVPDIFYLSQCLLGLRSEGEDNSDESKGFTLFMSLNVFALCYCIQLMGFCGSFLQLLPNRLTVYLYQVVRNDMYTVQLNLVR